MKDLQKKLEELKNETALELKAYVINDILEQDEEYMQGYIEDVLNHGCVSGTVSGLIYYTDTHKFFDEFYEEIMDLAHELEESLGTPLKVDGDLKNWYAWLSYEETLRAVAGELGMEI